MGPNAFGFEGGGIEGYIRGQEGDSEELIASEVQKSIDGALESIFRHFPTERP